MRTRRMPTGQLRGSRPNARFAMSAVPIKETPATFALAPSSARKLGRLQVCGRGFAAARIGLHIERKLLTLVEIAHASTFHRRNVHEHIGAAAVLNDKAVTLLGIEEFNGTCGHQWPPYKTRNGVVTHTNHFAWVLIRILRVLGRAV